jgi:hypothetical protein
MTLRPTKSCSSADAHCGLWTRGAGANAARRITFSCSVIFSTIKLKQMVATMKASLPFTKLTDDYFSRTRMTSQQSRIMLYCNIYQTSYRAA